MYNFDPYNVLLSIATNIPVLLMTDFVLQSHISATSGTFCNYWHSLIPKQQIWHFKAAPVTFSLKHIVLDHNVFITEVCS